MAQEIIRCVGVCFILMYIIVAILSVIFIPITGYDIINHRNNKIHGVHETYFTFNGIYEITIDHNKNDDLVFVTNCNANTSVGTCYYRSNEFYVYEQAINYGNVYCNNRTLYGFISTDTDKCTLYNPNVKIRKTIIAFAISIELLIFNIIIFNIYYYELHWKPPSPINSNSNYQTIRANNVINIIHMNNTRRDYVTNHSDDDTEIDDIESVSTCSSNTTQITN